MKKRKSSEKAPAVPAESIDYDQVLGGLVDLLESARRSSARAVNRFIRRHIGKSVAGSWRASKAVKVVPSMEKRLWSGCRST